MVTWIDPERAFDYVLRQRRGLPSTSAGLQAASSSISLVLTGFFPPGDFTSGLWDLSLGGILIAILCWSCNNCGNEDDLFQETGILGTQDLPGLLLRTSLGDGPAPDPSKGDSRAHCDSCGLSGSSIDFQTESSLPRGSHGLHHGAVADSSAQVHRSFGTAIPHPTLGH